MKYLTLIFSIFLCMEAQANESLRCRLQEKGNAKNSISSRVDFNTSLGEYIYPTSVLYIGDTHYDFEIQVDKVDGVLIVFALFNQEDDQADENLWELDLNKMGDQNPIINYQVIDAGREVADFKCYYVQ